VSVQGVSNLDDLRMQVSASPDVVTKPGTVVSRAVLSSTTLADSDGDGIGDSQERDRKLDPTNGDTEGDGAREGGGAAGCSRRRPSRTRTATGSATPRSAIGSSPPRTWIPTATASVTTSSSPAS